jgi:hypothetical protein
MAEGHACMIPMPDAATFLHQLEEYYRRAARKPKLLLCVECQARIESVKHDTGPAL